MAMSKWDRDTAAGQRVAIDEMLERLKRDASDADITWEIHDEDTEDPASSLEIIAKNGWGVCISLSISEER